FVRRYISIKWRCCLNCLFVTRQEECKRPSHTKTGDTQTVQTQRLEMRYRTSKDVHSPFAIQALHELSGLFGALCSLAVVEIGGQRGISLSREPVRDVLDVIVQSPPFLNHNQASLCLTFRRNKIAVPAFTFSIKVNHLPVRHDSAGPPFNRRPLIYSKQ